MDSKEQAQGIAAALFLFGRLLYVLPKGVSKVLALGRRAHAVPPEAILNWLAQGHCWQHGGDCEQAKVGSQTSHTGG